MEAGLGRERLGLKAVPRWMDVHTQLCGSKQGATPVPILPFLRLESALRVDCGQHFEINTVSSQGTGLVGGIVLWMLHKAPSVTLTMREMIIHFGF